MGTVRAELSFPLENRGQAPAAVARAVEEAALALGIAHLLDRSTAELSGGELQRVALGAALAGRPQLVVLDEPTSQLDPVAGDELIGLLRRINEDSDTTILLSEHRLERCLAAADRVIALADGRIVCDAPPDEFLAWAGRAAPRLQTPGARLLARRRPGARARASSERAPRCGRTACSTGCSASCGAPPAAEDGRSGGRRRAAAQPRRRTRATPRCWRSSTSGTSCERARRSCATSRSSCGPASGWR